MEDETKDIDEHNKFPQPLYVYAFQTGICVPCVTVLHQPSNHIRHLMVSI